MSLKVQGIQRVIEDSSTRGEDAATNQITITDNQGNVLLTVETDGSINLATGAKLKVAGNQVVSARGAAVADVATANADATYGQPEADLINELKAQLNALLGRLRSSTGHGLIT